MPIRICCTFMLHWPKRNAVSLPSGRDRLRPPAKRKAPSSEIRALRLKLLRSGEKPESENATLFAANTLPVIEAIRKTGVRDLRGIAAALNARGVRTPRGGHWNVSNVKNLVDRSF